MESGDSMETDCVWIPQTPAKPIPARSGHDYEAALNSEQGVKNGNLNEALPYIGSFYGMGYMERSGMNETNELPAGILDEHEAVLGVAGKDSKSTAAVQFSFSADDNSCVQEKGVKIPLLESDNIKGNGVNEPQVGAESVPTPSQPEKKNSRKRGNDGIDLNKKAGRARVKKHRPKILDDSKPKKVPKDPRNSTPRSKTPKPVTPNKVHERTTHLRKSTSTTGSISSTQSSTSYGFKDVVQDVQKASRASKIDVKSCKRSLVFDSHHVLKSHEEPPRLSVDIGKSDYYGKIPTSKRNTPRRSRFQNKSLEASVDLLEDNTKQDISIMRNQEHAEIHDRKYVNFYQRRKKISSNAVSYIHTPQVYHRTFKENQCLQNSKKSGPNFPKMFKKRRTLRKKVSIKIPWYIKPVKDGKNHVKISHKRLKRTTKKKVYKSKDKKQAVKSKIDREQWFLSVFSPKRRKRSVWHTRRRNIIDFAIFNMLYDDKEFVRRQEKINIQITECLPLQEVPVHRIESFTSLHRDYQQFDDSVGNFSWLQLQKVPVFGSHNMLPRQDDLNDFHVREMTEYITGKLANLDINDQCKELVVVNNNASGILVTPKKRKVLPKVDLDNETLRVWKLLMENDGSEPVEETDEKNEEWWERQRNIFRGRVDSFIAKMHLIQGDRRFTPWKGSVVDSVVGVYLTQNVADHLSSSAFMSLAARFPAKSRSKEVENLHEATSSQESVTINIKADEGFLKNNEIEQDMGISCAEASHATPTNEPNQEVVSNLLQVQDKPSIDGNSNTFRKLLEIEEVDFLQQFYKVRKDEPLNGCKVNGDSFDLSSSHEPCVIIPDMNEGSCETSVNTEREVVGGKNEDTQHLKHLENEFIVQQESTPEEVPKVVDPVCSPESEVTIEQGVDEANNLLDMKEVPLETGSTGKKKNKSEEIKTDWEKLRKDYCKAEGKERNENNMDAVDWDAVRRATVPEIAKIIAERGMNNVLAGRIKEDFLDRMIKDHGTIDLEWLRDVPPDKAKEFLLSIPGIGLKSAECVRLLTLHHLAFPVDTNVGRVATRLGWVPLQPLPDAIQIHLLNEYPMVDTIQKYLFPRLCTLDQRTLYELHYQLITFGKVFCTKIKPNCNACPMRAECRHYASAFASSRLTLPFSKESSNVTSIVPAANEQNDLMLDTPPSSFDLEVNNLDSSYHGQTCEPIIEVPPSPEPEIEETLPIISDIEDLFRDSDDEIPTIRLNTEEFRETLKDTIDSNNISLPEADMSKALVALSAEAASFRPRPMKFVAKLRTLHTVYELPDFHPSLAGFGEREHDDPTPYLLAIWLLGGSSKSVEFTENGACSSSSNNQEETVKGTVLIPCRTANRGRFPLNGTYFQVNEVFADDDTSQIPMDVPRSLLWDLPTRDLGCGTSATSIFKALSTGDIQHIFWRGSICVRGYNRKTRQPRPLHRRFHISTTAVAADNKKSGKK